MCDSDAESNRSQKANNNVFNKSWGDSETQSNAGQDILNSRRSKSSRAADARDSAYLETAQGAFGLLSVASLDFETTADTDAAAPYSIVTRDQRQTAAPIVEPKLMRDAFYPRETSTMVMSLPCTSDVPTLYTSYDAAAAAPLFDTTSEAVRCGSVSPPLLETMSQHPLDASCEFQDLEKETAVGPSAAADVFQVKSYSMAYDSISLIVNGTLIKLKKKETACQRIDQNGGKLDLRYSGVTLDIPAGALTQICEIQVNIFEAERAILLDGDEMADVSIIELLPHQQEFHTSVRIRHQLYHHQNIGV